MSGVPAYVEAALPRAPATKDHRRLNLALDRAPQGPGVVDLILDLEGGRLRVGYDPQALSREDAHRLAAHLAARLLDVNTIARSEMRVEHLLPCSTCPLTLECALRRLPGVLGVTVRYASGQVTVDYDPQTATEAQIRRRLSDLGVPVRPTGGDQAASWWARHELALLAGGAFLALIVGAVLEHLLKAGPWAIAAYVAAYLAGGWRATRTASAAIRGGALDINVLMLGSAAGAATIGYWEEGAILLCLFSLSTTLEAYAMERTRRAIRALMALRPDDAVLLRDGREVHVPVDALEVGDVIAVKPGARIPIDGTILAGTTSIDQSALTGESIPVGRVVGDPVFAGTINITGALEVRVATLPQETTLAKIIALVEEAQGQKATTQQRIDQLQQGYAIAVLAASAALATLPTLIFHRPFVAMFYRAMTLLVVASPCALVVGTPATVLAAITNGARRGILFKGGVHLERMGRVKVVAFDKTGTLTLGRPRVTDVIPAHGITSEELLRLAAALEQRSEHPLGSAIVEAARATRAPLPEPKAFEAVTGKGIRGAVGGQSIVIGTAGLLAEHGIVLPEPLVDAAERLPAGGKTTVFVASSRALGAIGIADPLRPEAPEACAALRSLGIRRLVVLTGDHAAVGNAVGAQVGADDVRAETLPHEKAETIHALRREFGEVAMVGDGINDAPALAAATVGIAMGAAGTDVALETADIVLMSSDLKQVAYAVALSRRTRQVIRQNLIFALGVIVTLVTATLLGHLRLPLAVVGHEGSTVLVVLNGLRLLAAVPTISQGSSASDLRAPVSGLPRVQGE
ncbi:MAG TPA: heavy metal translocating P-type ATPase [bacterium]|nr:heavy metal translocating P-type ATPase [bacterium]